MGDLISIYTTAGATCSTTDAMKLNFCLGLLLLSSASSNMESRLVDLLHNLFYIHCVLFRREFLLSE